MLLQAWASFDNLVHYWDRFSLLCQRGNLGLKPRPGAAVTCFFCLHAHAVRRW